MAHRPAYLSTLLVSLVFSMGACSSNGLDEEPAPEAPRSPGSRAVWTPSPGTTWQWHLGEGEVDPGLDVAVYDLDLFETDSTLVATLHQSGKKAICYLNAGAWEEWRPDAADFPPEVLGADYAGWAGEKWLDIREIDRLAPVLEKRLDLCREKGFDAVEPDNINGYENDTGFPLAPSDQIRFNVWLAEAAHSRGLSIGLKNDNEQADELEPHFDWAMTEDCFAQGWCEDMAGFIEAGKAVFQAEYTDSGIDFDAVCSAAGQNGFSPIYKNRDLDGWLGTCL